MCTTANRYKCESAWWVSCSWMVSPYWGLQTPIRFSPPLPLSSLEHAWQPGRFSAWQPDKPLGESVWVSLGLVSQWVWFLWTETSTETWFSSRAPSSFSSRYFPLFFNVLQSCQVLLLSRKMLPSISQLSKHKISSWLLKVLQGAPHRDLVLLKETLLLPQVLSSLLQCSSVLLSRKVLPSISQLSNTQNWLLVAKGQSAHDSLPGQ